jgi:ABC-2 type transport system permease protein
VSMILGLIAGILIYVFIFSFGSQVMRGVIEEKTSRIVEIIVSSVKPFQLMMGKILGIAMVGLTQFVLWILLSFLIITSFQLLQPEKFSLQDSPQVMLDNKGLTPDEVEQMKMSEMIASDQGNKILEGIASINFDVIIMLFLFYFIFGYLMYAALFAAIGSAVDNEADTQQFMLPVTAPLIISILMAQMVINNPDGVVAFWLSIIPLTSPVIMMVRIPFGVHWTELALSMSLMVAGFLATTWFAAKIYRTGILMYGKKSSYKELAKWLFHK